MPNPYPVALRERAVGAYGRGEGSYVALAEDLAVSVRSLLRRVQQARATGDLTPRPKRGGWQSPVEMAVLDQVIAARADATSEELRRAYNRQVTRVAIPE
jgi:transposase-like protein